MKKRAQKEKSSNNPLSHLYSLSPWEKGSNPIWIATSLKLFRNLDNFPFSGKLSEEKRKQILQLVKQSLPKLNHLKDPKVIEAETLAPTDKEFLFERFLSLQSFHQAQIGEGFILEEQGEFLGIINVRDHLQLQLTVYSEEIEEGLNHLISIENDLGKQIKYSYSPKFGFLTANPELCGTALQVSIFLHLPTLIHSGKIKETLKVHLNEGVIATGIQGDPNELVGDLLVLRNKYTFGLSEENIISSIRTAATKIMLDEKMLRAKLLSEGDEPLKDKVYRAYGLLNNSIQLETVETMNALSLIGLGVEFKWIKGISREEVLNLLFISRRSHLLHKLGVEISQEELPKHRAEMIRKVLKKTKSC